MATFHSVLITGANRGIGLEFVRQFLENSDIAAQHAIATSRAVEHAFDLLELQKKHSKLQILKLDVTDFEAFDAFATELGKIVGEKGLMLLINNAALGNACLTERMDSLEEVRANAFITSLVTNVAGPVLLTKALLPLLKQSALANNKCHNDGLSVTRAAIINIGSIFGSCQISATDTFYKKVRSYGYRESKAALNMATESMIIDLGKDGILVESIYPGTVDTRLTAKLNDQYKISTATSVREMLNLMLALKGDHKNGFYQYDGALLPL